MFIAGYFINFSFRMREIKLASGARGVLPLVGWVCWGVTAGNASHNASNARGVTAGKMGRNSSYVNEPR